jgi:hypothetical protein
MSARSELPPGLRTGSWEVAGACLLSPEGFIAASAVATELELERIGGVTASRAAVTAVGRAASRVSLVTGEARLALVFLELERTTARLLEHVA